MDFHSSPLANDVDYVINDPTATTSYFIGAKISAGGKTLDTLKVLSIDEVENYGSSCFTVTTMEAVVGLGSYVKEIYPMREDLEIVIYREDTSGRVPLRTDTYKAILLTQQNPEIESNKYQNISKDTLDISSVIEIQFQLISKVSEELRLSTTGGVYRQADIKSVLQYSLTEVMEKIESEDSTKPLGVDLIDGSNEEVYEQIVIPHGTNLMDVPGFLQNKSYGVYPTGLGHFFKNGFWYIYPLFDTDRFDNFRDSIDITLVPGTLFEMLDKTSKRTGSSVLILCAGERYLNNDPEQTQQQEGLGKRFSNPNSLIEKFADVLGQTNKAIISRGLNNTEFMDTSNTSELNNAPMADQSITSNSLKQMSEVASRKGQHFTANWRFSDPTIFFPGMTLRVKMLNNGVVEMFTGTIISTTHQTQLVGKGMTSYRYFCTTTMSAFISRL